MKLLVVGEKMRVSEGLHDFVTRRLSFALGCFAPEIDRITYRLRGIHCPRGGMDRQRVCLPGDATI